MLPYPSRAIIILLIGILSCSCFSTHAQEKQKNKKKYSGEVTIIAPYQPSIQEAKKITVLPEVNIITPKKRVLEYHITPQKISSDLTLTPMPVIKLQRKKDTPIPSNYLKGGIGTYLSPYGELFCTSKQSQNYRIGFHGKHFSRMGQINPYAKTQNSYNKAKVFGEKYLNGSSIYGSLLYDRFSLHRHGFIPKENMSYSPDSIKQIFSQVNALVRYENTDIDDHKLDYHAMLSYNYWQDYYSAMQNQVKTDLYIKNPVDWFSFLSHQSFGANMNIEYSHNNDTLEVSSAMLTSIQPFIAIKSGVYQLEAGANFSMFLSPHKTNPDVNIFPQIKGRLNVVPRYLSIFASLGGYHSYEGPKELSDINPYIGSIVDNDFTTYKIDANGGLSGNILRYVDFVASLGYKKAKNHPLFVADFTSEYNHLYRIIRDDIAITQYHCALSLNKWERLKINTTFNYFSYVTEQEEAAWHMPSLTAEISAKYSLQPHLPPLSFTLSSVTECGRVAKDENNALISLKDRYLINFLTEYRHNNHLTAFLTLNNILNQRYEMWLNYPSYRFNAMIGVSYSF